MNFEDLKIKVRDPLAVHLGGPLEIEEFSLSLLDVARLSGHLCPSVAGAFLAVDAAVTALFSDKVCERGLLEVELPGTVADGANGPISNVIGYITGAWAESGFGGLGGEHRRRGLLRFGTQDLRLGQIRFIRRDTGQAVEITYNPLKANNTSATQVSFQAMWQQKVLNIISSPAVIQIRSLN